MRRRISERFPPLPLLLQERFGDLDALLAERPPRRDTPNRSIPGVSHTPPVEDTLKDMASAGKDLIALNRYAECGNADPRLFDAMEPMAAAPALAHCARCTVVPLCRSVLRPSRTFYDGVAAAAVWRNGRVVASLARDRQTRALVSTLNEGNYP